MAEADGRAEDHLHRDHSSRTLPLQSVVQDSLHIRPDHSDMQWPFHPDPAIDQPQLVLQLRLNQLWPHHAESSTAESSDLLPRTLPTAVRKIIFIGQAILSKSHRRPLPSQPALQDLLHELRHNLQHDMSHPSCPIFDHPQSVLQLPDRPAPSRLFLLDGTMPMVMRKIIFTEKQSPHR